MPNSSIRPIDRTSSGDTAPGKRGTGSDDNEGMLHITKSSFITAASPSDCLVSYPGHLLVESYPFAEKKSVFSIAPPT